MSTLTVILKWILGFKVKVNVLTCDYIDFYRHIELWKGYLLSFVVSFRLFVFFNNYNTVSAEMWAWSFGNHAWYKSLVKSLVLDSWLETFVSFLFPKPHTHISYSQYFHTGVHARFQLVNIYKGCNIDHMICYNFNWPKIK